MPRTPGLKPNSGHHILLFRQEAIGRGHGGNMRHGGGGTPPLHVDRDPPQTVNRLVDTRYSFVSQTNVVVGLGIGSPVVPGIGQIVGTTYGGCGT